MKKVKFDFSILDDIVADIIKTEYLFDKENVGGLWIEDETGRVTNIILDMKKENKWNLKTFSFIDMMQIEKGLSLLFIFSNDEGRTAITYQKTFSCVGDMLVSQSPFKDMLTYVKSNKEKISFEQLDSGFGFMDFEEIN